MPPAEFMTYVTPLVVLIAQVAHAYWLKRQTREALQIQTDDLKSASSISLAVQTSDLKNTAAVKSQVVADKLDEIHEQVNGNLDQMMTELRTARAENDRLAKLLEAAKTKK